MGSRPEERREWAAKGEGDVGCGITLGRWGGGKGGFLPESVPPRIRKQGGGRSDPPPPSILGGGRGGPLFLELF